MIYRTLIALSALGAAVMASDVARAQYSFSGGALVTAVSGADCDAVSAQVGEMYTVVFRPVQAGINTAALQFLQNQTAFRMQPTAGGNFAASGQYAAIRFTGRAGLQNYQGNYSQFRIAPLPTATRLLIDIRGRITNFKNGGNCTVTFAAGLVLRKAD
jgi:hypothetical protein